MQHFETYVTFTCPNCTNGNLVQIQVPELDLSGESFSDHYSEGEVDWACPDQSCREEFYGYAHCSYAGCEITFEYDDKEYRLNGAPPMYSEESWLDTSSSDFPYIDFESAMESVVKVLEIPPLADDEQLLNRMALVQCISAMEAYLHDMLISHVLDWPKSLQSLLENEKNLKNIKFTLVEISRDKNLIVNQVTKHLHSVIYHNLPRVQYLYQTAFQIDIKSDDYDWEIIQKGVINRHDCAHRNGVNSEGEISKVCTKDYVTSVLEAISRMVDHIDQEFKNYSKT